MKVVFVNRFFHPDHSATSQLLSDLAFFLVVQGLQVTIITSRQIYDDPIAKLAANEVIRGVNVRRVWTSRFGRQRLWGRALDYLSFYFAAGRCLLRTVRTGDIVVAKTDPPLISVVACVVTKLRGASLINWIQDLFPEVGTALKVRGVRFVDRPLRLLRNASLRAARRNVVLGELMARRLAAQGVREDSTSVIHNWSDEAHIWPIDRDKNPLRKEWGLKKKFVVGYSGNMGRAHEFETIIDAAELLKDKEGLRFLFIGGGAQADHIARESERRGLCNVIFKPYQPRDKLSFGLGVADVHLISLQPDLEGLIVPSKFYGIAAAGRPTIYIGARDGEIPAILKRAACGITVEPGQGGELARRIEELSGDQSTLARLGQNARSLFDREFSKSHALAKWRAVIDGVK